MGVTVSMNKLVPFNSLSHDQILLKDGLQCHCSYSRDHVIDYSQLMEGYAQDLLYIL